MAISTETYRQRLARLKADLKAQGQRVQTVLEASFESAFAGDVKRAQWVVAQDDTIDKVDLQIEQAAVDLLFEAAHCVVEVDTRDLRSLLVIVKVNNELERTADAATAIAERVEKLTQLGEQLPATFRVLANSVVGMVRDVNNSMERGDVDLARKVLKAEDTTEAFLETIIRESEQEIASGSMSVDFAFLLHTMAHQCVLVADYVANVAEQVIYALSGAVVRHTEGKWIDVPRPDQD